MSKQMKLIIESWREKFLKEEFAGEEKWNKGRDSDFNTKILFFVNDKYINEPYPKPDGQNHGMVSHAIKHAHEFFEIDSDLAKFKASSSASIHSTSFAALTSGLSSEYIVPAPG